MLIIYLFLASLFITNPNPKMILSKKKITLTFLLGAHLMFTNIWTSKILLDWQNSVINSCALMYIWEYVYDNIEI